MAVLAAASIGLTLAVAAPSSAATAPTPVLAGSVSNQSVKVAWKFSTGIDRSELQLEIDRGPDAAHFSVWKTLARPRPAAYRLDRQPLTPTGMYRARVIVKGVAGAWSNTISVGTANTPPPPPPPPPSGPCATAKSDILRLVNQARAANGVSPALTDDSRLDTAAQAHTNYMTSTLNFDHTGWVAEIAATGYPGGTLGQNIAAGYTTASSVMQGWMNSPGHKANILNPSFKNLGVGCGYTSSGPYHWYWTQDFGG